METINKMETINNMKITKNNFFNGTKGLFKECGVPKREPDYISKNGSKYWYTSQYLIRQSNHWSNVLSNKTPLFNQYDYAVCGMIKTCHWTIWVDTPIKLNKQGNRRANWLFDKVKKGQATIYELQDFFERLSCENIDNNHLCGKIRFEDLQKIYIN